MNLIRLIRAFSFNAVECRWNWKENFYAEFRLRWKSGFEKKSFIEVKKIREKKKHRKYIVGRKSLVILVIYDAHTDFSYIYLPDSVLYIVIAARNFLHKINRNMQAFRSLWLG